MVLRLSGPGAQAGFSLIELMVVVAITSILAVGATLALGRGGDPDSDAVAALEAQAADLRARAMLTGAVHRLEMQAGGWVRMDAGGQVLGRTEAAGAAGPALVFDPGGAVTGGPVRIGGWLCAAAAGALPRCAAP